ncbi:hypothetical protein CEK62_09290 [Alcanivorax sp. N3-2A]|nr:hypothetical protein CEK62_09290 [Alcanivorax sp. N3-2A]
MEQAVRREIQIHPYLYVYRTTTGRFWWCAVPYLDGKGRRRQRRKSFRDDRYHSKRLALIAAQRWRDQQIERPEVRSAMGDRRPLVLVEKDSSGVGRSDNPFGLVGITASFRKHPLGGNFSATANRGRKKWFSMRRYGAFEAFKMAVEQRCKWVAAPMPSDEELRDRYDPWTRNNKQLLREHRVES